MIKGSHVHLWQSYRDILCFVQLIYNDKKAWSMAGEVAQTVSACLASKET